ncbi:DUF4255 domain-containing protein [Haliangium sp.]|uniref:DUF4255 domain-containing protein n=1 Tax=Haliangium sp. TaxID=2663208 RepID=UPI003D0AA89A
MPDFDVVADVSETLRSVVTAGLSTLMPPPAPTAEVVDLLRPVQSSSSAKVTIFLYEIAEDPSARNRPYLRRPAGADVELQRPPMALLLRYMVTPWSGDWSTDQKILGRVLQIFYDNAILSGPQLQAGLAGTSEAIKLTLAPITLEDRARVWYSVQQPYRLSLTYEARVVNLDSVDIQGARRAREVAAQGAEASA